MRLKVDNRIRVVLENAAAAHHRALIVLVGEKSKDQVVFIHNLLSNTCLQQASVLWCYKKELSLSSNRKKRFRQIQAAMKTGQFDANEDNLFEKFVSTTSIKYCYYKDTYRVLGNTFKMCVLQDFEGVTANTLCRTVETVEGGGAVVLLLQSIDSLRQLYTLCMDVHARYRTPAHQHIVPRFNERLLQSLSSCSTCIVIDDQLRVVPHSSHVTHLVPSDEHRLAAPDVTEDEAMLKGLPKSVKGCPPVEKLLALCKTLDQAKVLLQFSMVITEKLLNTTVSLTAARGRGKSAAMGLAIACAIAFGYDNIYVTSPSPENLKTFFEFLEKGLQAAGYEEDLHYNVTRATSEEGEGQESKNVQYQKCITQIVVTRKKRQVIQYISPKQTSALSQAEIVVIDEAAAIPLPLVRAMIGPYLVFLSSTVGGYEGTGRSLSLKLIAELRADSERVGKGTTATNSKRKLVELTLEESIRYRRNDPVESWLSSLLCLEPALPPLPTSLPAPHLCSLYYVNRDALFAYHKLSEEFLSSIQSLLVSSHYRNSPDDLQRMSDAPAHHLFVLLPPHNDTSVLPPVLVVMQVVLEGGISRALTITGLECSDGAERPPGDLIPWTLSGVFMNYDFPQLSGARVFRVATHPGAQGNGYGSRAIQLLEKYYKTNAGLAGCKEQEMKGNDETVKIVKSGELAHIGSVTAGKAKCSESGTGTPPLLVPVSERPAEPMHYLGVAYGVSHPLFTFWKRAGFSLVYISQERNGLTGEHTAIMLQQLQVSPQQQSEGGIDVSLVTKLWLKWQERLASLLDTSFNHFSCQMALSAITNPQHKTDKKGSPRICRSELTLSDIGKLSSYVRHQCEASHIVNVTLKLAKLYFCGHIPETKLKTMQAAVLCGLGFLSMTEAALAEEFSLQKSVILEQKRTMLKTLHDALKPVLTSYDEDSEDEELKSASKQVMDEDTAKIIKLSEAAKEELELQKQAALQNAEEQKNFVQRQRKRTLNEDRSRQTNGARKKKKLNIEEIRKTKKML